MRRRSATVSQADELFGADLDRASALDPEKVIAQLEPLVTPERRQRLLGTIDLRLDSVAAVMDSPHDPHNGAAVMRSCDAFGVQRLHVLARRESFVVATSVAKGSHKWVDVVTHTTAASVRDAMESSGHELVAAEASGELAPDDLATIPRFALVLGNEREGIGADLRRLCPRAVRIPMRGFADSINVSVCAALLLARAVQGRAGDLPAPERRRLYARGLFLTVPHAIQMLAPR